MVEADEVYLPLEVVTREYAGKLLLALELANKGFRVILGHKEPVKKLAMNAPRPGVFFFKSVPRVGDACFEAIRKLGFVTVVQDEEAGVAYADFGRFYELRPHLQRFNEHDAFFCWGLDDYDFLRCRHVDHAHKLFLTGSPRGFLWSKRENALLANETESFRRRYGRYILFVGNFVLTNSARGDEHEVLSAYQRAVGPAVPVEIMRSDIDLDRRLRRVFVQAAREVCKALQLSVVIRPHPVEDWKNWQHEMNGCDGIHVETGGDLLSLIRAAEAVVQNGCTSAIESRLAGVPVFALAESEADIQDRWCGTFANLIAKHAFGTEALIKLLRDRQNVWAAFVAEVPDSVLDKKVLRSPEGAPRAIANVISTLAFPARKSMGRKGMRSVNGIRKGKDGSRPSKLVQNKRREITLEAISSDIGRASSLLALERDFRVEPVATCCFAISAP